MAVRADQRIGNRPGLAVAGFGRDDSEVAGNTFEMNSSGVSIQTSAECKVQASTVPVTASSVSVNASMATFSGVVQCQTLVASSVISSSYTPGAGNVW